MNKLTMAGMRQQSNVRVQPQPQLQSRLSAQHAMAERRGRSRSPSLLNSNARARRLSPKNLPTLPALGRMPSRQKGRSSCEPEVAAYASLPSLPTLGSNGVSIRVPKSKPLQRSRSKSHEHAVFASKATNLCHDADIVESKTDADVKVFADKRDFEFTEICVDDAVAGLEEAFLDAAATALSDVVVDNAVTVLEEVIVDAAATVLSAVETVALVDVTTAVVVVAIADVAANVIAHVVAVIAHDVDAIVESAPVVDIQDKTIVQSAPVVDIQDITIVESHPVVDVQDMTIVESAPVSDIHVYTTVESASGVEDQDNTIVDSAPVSDVQHNTIVESAPVSNVQDNTIVESAPVSDVQHNTIVESAPVLDIHVDTIVESAPVSNVQDNTIVESAPVSNVQDNTIVESAPVLDIHVDTIVESAPVSNVQDNTIVESAPVSNVQDNTIVDTSKSDTIENGAKRVDAIESTQIAVTEENAVFKSKKSMFPTISAWVDSHLPNLRPFSAPWTFFERMDDAKRVLMHASLPRADAQSLLIQVACHALSLCSYEPCLRTITFVEAFVLPKPYTFSVQVDHGTSLHTTSRAVLMTRVPHYPLAWSDLLASVAWGTAGTSFVRGLASKLVALKNTPSAWSTIPELVDCVVECTESGSGYGGMLTRNAARAMLPTISFVR